MYLITIYTKGGNTLTFVDDSRRNFIKELITYPPDDDNTFVAVNNLEEDGADEYVRISSIELISVEEIDG